MANTIGWTQADIDSLRTAIASGALTVSFSGPPARSITYRSLAEMERILARAVSEVKGAPPRVRLAYFNKGT